MIREYTTHSTVCDACERENTTTIILNSIGDGWHRVGIKDLCPTCYAKFVVSLEDLPGFDKHLEQFVKDSAKYPGYDTMLMGGTTLGAVCG